MDINKNVRYITGKQNKQWSVSNLYNGDFVVSDNTDVDDPDIVSQEVDNCNGTYFQYNPSCPHIEAVEEHQILQSIEIMDKTDAIEKIDFDEIEAKVYVTQRDEYLVVRTDGEYGFVEFKIYYDDDGYVVREIPAKRKCAGSLEMYDTYDIASVQVAHDYRLGTLLNWMIYETKIQNPREVWDKIKDNLGDKI